MICLNGHEWVKQQLWRQRIRFESLDNVVVGVSATAGLVLSLVTTRLLAGLLYAAADVSVYALASLLIAFVAAVACLVPARRAMRIQPSSALRFE